MKKLSMVLGVVAAFAAVVIMGISVLSITGIIDLSARSLINVRFYNYDATLLYETEINYNEDAEYVGATPLRPESDDFYYQFSGWNKSLEKLQVDTIFVAQYFVEVKQVKVTFLNHDSSVLYEDFVTVGATAEYFGSVPTRAHDGVNRFKFAGWDQPLTNISAPTTFTAIYTAEPAIFTVTFRNYDEEILYVDEVAAGATATYSGLAPTRASDAIFTYTFSTWDKHLENVSDDFDTYPVFDQVNTLYTVTFYNEYSDPQPLYITYTHYDGTAEYLGPRPSKPSTLTHAYAFKGWNKPITNITKDTVLVATFDIVPNTFVIRFLDHEDNELYKAEVLQGETAIYRGDPPTRASDAQYDYEFVAWDRLLTNVQESFTTKPRYEYVLKQFFVTFLNYDGQYLDRIKVGYGQTARFSGPTPVRADSGGIVYNFSGWSHSLNNITSDLTVIAKYTSYTGGTLPQKTVFYYAYDGLPLSQKRTGLLAAEFVDEGASATYTGDENALVRPYSPVHERDFVFVSWSAGKALDNVRENITTYAQYETTLGEIIVTYRNPYGALLYEDIINVGDASFYEGVEHDYLLRENGFESWSSPLTNIKESITVYPRFSVYG